MPRPRKAWARAGASLSELCRDADLRGARIGVIREFMQPFTKADEDSIRIAEGALRDLAKAGATIVDPGPKGALFKDAIAAILPALDTPTLASVYREMFPPGTSMVAKSVELTAMRRGCRRTFPCASSPSASLPRRAKSCLR